MKGSAVYRYTPTCSMPVRNKASLHPAWIVRKSIPCIPAETKAHPVLEYEVFPIRSMQPNRINPITIRTCAVPAPHASRLTAQRNRYSFQPLFLFAPIEETTNSTRLPINTNTGAGIVPRFSDLGNAFEPELCLSPAMASPKNHHTQNISRAMLKNQRTMLRIAFPLRLVGLNMLMSMFGRYFTTTYIYYHILTEKSSASYI